MDLVPSMDQHYASRCVQESEFVTNHMLKIMDEMQRCLTGKQSADDIDWLISKANSLAYMVNNIAKSCDVHPATVTLVQQLLTEIEQLKSGHVESNVKNAVIAVDVVEGKRGRPMYKIPYETLAHLLELSFSAADIARLLRVSKRTIFRRLKEYKLSVGQMYSTLSDEELDMKVAAIVAKYPFTGYRRMMGFLRDEGENVQEKRVVSSMRRVDYVGIIQRSTASRVIHRRKYSVKGIIQITLS